MQQSGRCLPFERGEGLPLTQPAALLVPVSKLARLKRGRSERFSTGRREFATGTDVDDDCRKATDPVVGMKACARTRIELDVKRVR
ncbi:hypothetical protein AB0L40_04475 [Patulibacter sp. NPDC049589]|uniref:hypothetical protein n=1 Tax=Patulibacter sp. NPDC049589 TaxID=3154731 RepID=UPI003429FB5B